MKKNIIAKSTSKKNLGILSFFLLSATGLTIADIFSKELLKPKRSTFDDDFYRYIKNLNYNSSFYLTSKADSFFIKSEDNYNLYIEYFKAPNKSKKTIYFLHGYSTTRAQSLWFLEMYHNLGFNVVIYDQIASGESGGCYSTMGVKESRDLKTIVDYIKKTYGESEITVLHGISMGASTAIYYGEKYGEIDYIIADCGYSSMRNIVLYQFKQQFNLPTFPFIPLTNLGLKFKANYTLNNINCLKSVASNNFNNIKLLIIHGKEDIFTPVSMAYNLYDASIGYCQLKIFENAGHANCYELNPIDYKEIVTDFLLN